MPEFTEESKRKYAFKNGLGVLHTNNSRQWFAEKYKNAPNVKSENVWAEIVLFAGTVAQADTNASTYSQITKIITKLTEEPGHNSFLYLVRETPGDSESDLIMDSIGPTDVPSAIGAPSTGYSVRLYQDNGAGGKGPEITTTSGAWIWNYKACALILDEGHTAAIEGWTTPLHIDFYQYTGVYVSTIATPQPVEDKTEIIEIDESLSKTTVYDVRFSEDSPGYTRDTDRDEVNLGESATIFRDNETIQVYFGGMRLEKGIEVTWVSQYQFSIDYDAGDGDKISLVYSGEVPGYGPISTFLDKRTTQKAQYVTIPEITEFTNVILLDSSMITGTVAKNWDSTQTSGGLLAAALDYNINPADDPLPSSLVSTHGDDEVSGNIVSLRYASNQQPVIDLLGKRVYGILQCSQNLADGDSVGPSETPNIQITFIGQTRSSSLYKVLIKGTIQISVSKLYSYKNLPASSKYQNAADMYDGALPIQNALDFREENNAINYFMRM